MKVVVLGAGRVGAAIARDLAGDPDLRVTAADASDVALGALEETADLELRRADLSDPEELNAVVKAHDLVVGALPGHLGFRSLRTVIEAGRDAVDISFFAEDPFDLHDRALERGVRVLVDCGVAPGLSNLILGRDRAELERVDRFECLVGGLPVTRFRPFEYRAPFSPADVIEEYLRPARIRRRGGIVVREALSEVEPVDFPEIGTLEAFLTDGLRTLLQTTDVPEMVEKTLRYPGHAETMRTLREAGFLARDPVDVDGVEVSPLALSSQLLEELWRFREGEEDLTVMRVTVEGRSARGRALRRTYHLLDRYDRDTGTLSMARTTGYTCTACVRLLARDRFPRPGVSAPEHLGARAGCLDFVLEELESRGVTIRYEENPRPAGDSRSS